MAGCGLLWAVLLLFALPGIVPPAATGLGLNIRELDATMYDVLLDDVPIEDCIEPTSLRNLFAAPANLDLAGAVQPAASARRAGSGPACSSCRRSARPPTAQNHTLKRV